MLVSSPSIPVIAMGALGDTLTLTVVRGSVPTISTRPAPSGAPADEPDVPVAACGYVITM